MNYRQLVNYTVPPVTLAEVKNALKLSVSDTDDDALLFAMIRTATDSCQDYTGLSLNTQTWKLSLDCFPGGGDEWWDGVRQGVMNQTARPFIELDKGPVQSVTSLKTYDDDDTAYTFDLSNYYVDTASKPARLVLRRSVVWPTTVLRPANGIEVEFVAGYGSNQNAVPHGLRQGILQHVASMYEHRGEMLGPDGKFTEVPPLPVGAILLYNQKRIFRL